MSSPYETIVAPITATGGAVSAVRISGSASFQIADKVFNGLPKTPTPRTAYYGNFKHGDDGYCILFDQNHAYTAEDSAEFYIHGSAVSGDILIHNCLEQGARIAQPGEFTMRAYLNGRIDLAQAEAVADAVQAHSLSMLQASVSQAKGSLSKKIEVIEAHLTQVLVSIEAWVDYSEEIGEINTDSLVELLQNSLEVLEECIDVAKLASVVRKKPRVAIIGPPNAGKSSLFNALLQKDRAIVTSTPGTTRDTISDFVSLSSLQFELVDTAGLRNSQDEIERLGIQRSIETAKSADLVLFVFDATEPFPILPEILEILMDNGIKIANKIDLISSPTEREGVVNVSAQTGSGLSLLVAEIQKALQPKNTELPYLPNDRQYRLLVQCSVAINTARETLEHNLPLDLASSCIQESLSLLGEITGKSVQKDIFEQIFAKFCIGK